jgi:sugar fermentation stimulation protein A
MIIEGQKLRGTFISRPNRFLALVKINEGVVPCYLPDPGRLKELLHPGVELVVRTLLNRSCSHRSPKRKSGKRPQESTRGGIGRKTRYDILAVVREEGDGEKLVSLDSRLPNRLVHEALLQKQIKEFQEYNKITPEYTFGSSRLDFLLERWGDASGGRCLLEVKSCNLTVDGVALFPDAPTERGRRHVEELVEAKTHGKYDRACVLFIVQRDDAHRFEPYRSNDPIFAEALHYALSRGVEAYAYTERISEDEMLLFRSIPVNA